MIDLPNLLNVSCLGSSLPWHSKRSYIKWQWSRHSRCVVEPFLRGFRHLILLERGLIGTRCTWKCLLSTYLMIITFEKWIKDPLSCKIFICRNRHLNRQGQQNCICNKFTLSYFVQICLSRKGRIFLQQR